MPSRVNELVVDIIARLLRETPPRVPTTYGDGLLDNLLGLIQYARVSDFRFVDAAGVMRKRNVLEWIKGRLANRRLTHDKLYGFARFAVRLSWRADVAQLLSELLDDVTVLESVKMMTQDSGSVIKELRRCIAVNPFARNQEGEPPRNVSYGVLSWSHEIKIDIEGNGSHHVCARLCNLGRDGLSLLTPPVFLDEPCTPESLSPWARCSSRQVSAHVEGWTGTAGDIFITLAPPLEYYEQVDIEWGYVAPRLFKHGEEYYRFDINNPTAYRAAALVFDWALTVADIRTLDGRLKVSPSENRIFWEHYFPPYPATYELRCSLSPRGNATQGKPHSGV